MRVPIGWLGELVDLPDGVTAEHLHAAFVKVGFEEEAVHAARVTGPVVVGEVLSLEPEPQKNGKTINWCRVDVGEPEPRGIVCGAHNFGVGDRVVVTLPGAALPGPTADEPFLIAARKTYGHVSDGMIASARELGYGDEHDGILVLAELGLGDAPVGADAIQLLHLDDSAVEVNVTPDRGYALSMRGMAREYALSTGAAFRDPALDEAALDRTPVDGAFPVRVDDDGPVRGRTGCTGFVARVVRDIDASRPTPAWMRSRLQLAGIRPISLPVDITNYVMWELGQPIHGYDLATLTGGLVVRRARPGETLETLDGVVRTLHAEDLLITDDSGPIGLAGVMGGAATEMGAATADVLIEAAHFDPTSIARTARRHRLPSEASRRFERGVDPAVAEAAAARVVALLVELAGGTADTLGAVLADGAVPQPIDYPAGAAEALTGIDLVEGEAERVLTALGCTVERRGDDLVVRPPTWRPDLTDRAALVEEVARIAGYDRIPSTLPVAPPGRGLTRRQRLQRAISAGLAAGGGVEVQSPPFLSADQHALVSGDAPAMRLANAIDAQQALLRRSLLPGLLDVARRNLSRGLTDLDLFEVGDVYLPAPGAEYGIAELPPGGARPDAATIAALEASVPPQPRHVGGLLLGDATPKQPGLAARPGGLADALDAVDRIAAVVGARIDVRQGAHPALHPGRTAELVVQPAGAAPADAAVVGIAGELLPRVAADLDLPAVVALWELDLDALLAAVPERGDAHPLSGLPAATQDLSLVVDRTVAAADVLAAVVEGAGALLEHARLTDDYRGPGVPDDAKSLTFALRFRAADRTLTAAEATEAKLAGVARATERTGARLRE